MAQYPEDCCTFGTCEVARGDILQCGKEHHDLALVVYKTKK